MALGILNGQLFIRFNGNNEKLSEYLLTFAGRQSWMRAPS